MNLRIAPAGFPVAALDFLSALSVVPVNAQDLAGIISGTITDPSDAAVPNATVKLVQDDTRDAKTQTTNAVGYFSFLDMLPGKYTLTVTATGFRGLERQNINLTASERLSPGRIPLQIGAANESVTVTAQGARRRRNSEHRGAALKFQFDQRRRDRRRR